MWKSGASNGGCHYLGCAKTMAQIGKAFAEAMLEMETSSPTTQQRERRDDDTQ